MKAGSPSKTAGWPRIAAVACLFLVLPGCASLTLLDKMENSPKAPNKMQRVELASRSLGGTVNLCMERLSGRPPYRSSFMIRVPIDANPQNISRKKASGTDRTQPDQAETIPYLTVPASTVRLYCSEPGSRMPVFWIYATGYPYILGRIEPAVRSGRTGQTFKGVALSDARLRKEIRDRIIAHKAPSGIYQINIKLPDGQYSTAVFYKYSSGNTAPPESRNTKVVQLGISGKGRKMNSHLVLLWPAAILFDIVTFPVVVAGTVFSKY